MNIKDRNPLLLGVVALCAMGVGITGTMLWMQERTPKAQSVAVSSSSNTAAPSQGAPSEAPPALPPTTQLSSAQTALDKGNSFYDAGQWKSAIQQYRLVIEGGYDNPNVRTDMGNALRFDGQPQQALEQYKIAQNQDPTHEQSLFNQGGLWAFALNDKEKAVQAWRAYLKKFPNGQSAPDARKFLAQHQGKQK